MNFHWKNIGKPTPQLIENGSNAILVGCIFISGSSYLVGHDVLALVWVHIGGLAKMLSTFFGSNQRD